jgi:hypothetical protein
MLVERPMAIASGAWRSRLSISISRSRPASGVVSVWINGSGSEGLEEWTRNTLLPDGDVDVDVDEDEDVSQENRLQQTRVHGGAGKASQTIQP